MFDVFARGNDQPGLVILEEDGTEASYSFATLVDTSDQLAAWLSQQGVGKGDAVLVMLGNQVELWQTMLAVMKLGAVIMPTTTRVRTWPCRLRGDPSQAGPCAAALRP